MSGCRYRLQRKKPWAMPNILGNHYFPVYTYRWVDIAASDSREALEEIRPKGDEYRIEDTQQYENLEQEG